MYGEEGDDIMIGGQGDDRMFGGSQQDDMIGGHNVAGGFDEGLTGTAIAATGSNLNDLMDGGSEDDFMAGDNAVIWRRGDTKDVRHQVLSGSVIYTATETTIAANVTHAVEGQANPNGTTGRDITLLDHADNDSRRPVRQRRHGGRFRE